MNRVTVASFVWAALLLASAPALAQRGSEKATLVLESQPVGADILIDGKASGATARSIEVEAGAHTVQMTKAGFEPYTKKIKVKAGEKLRLRGSLKAAAVKATPVPAPARTPTVAKAPTAGKTAGKTAAKAAPAKAPAETPKSGREAAPEPPKSDLPISKGPASGDGEEGSRRAEPATAPAPHDERAEAAAAKDDPRGEAARADEPSAPAKPPAATGPRKKKPKPPATVAPVDAAPVTSPVAARPVEPPPASSGPSLRTVGWIGLAVGVALTGGAIATNVLANQKYDAVSKAGKDRNGLTFGLTQVEARDQVDRGNLYRTVSSVLYVVGGTAVGVSTFLVLFGGGSDSAGSSPTFTIAPLPGGGAFSLQGGF